MYQPNRFVRVGYTDEGESRILYGFSPDAQSDDEVIKDCVVVIEGLEHCTVVDEINVVSVCGNLSDPDRLLERSNVA